MSDIRFPAHAATFGPLLDALQRQLADALAETRAKFRSTTEKGTNVEEELRVFLREYLPRSLSVGHGEVLDTFGGRSPQTDVVIATDEHPATFTATRPGLFLIEAVAAAGEVKSVLTSQEFANSLENAKRFKQLKAFNMPGAVLTYGGSDRVRFGSQPPYFLFAFESQLTMETISTAIETQPGGTVFDAVFALNRGFAIDFGDGQGSLKVGGVEKPATGWGYWEGGQVLAQFISWLSIIMRRVRYPGPILPLYLLPYR